MNKFFRSAVVMLTLILSTSSLSAQKKIQTSHNTIKEGKASYYHHKFVGRKTSTGEIFSNHGYTAASNFFKLGTYVKVTNKKNGRYIYVKINDRMGHPSRVIDCTERVAKELNFKNAGTADVHVEAVSPEEGKRRVLAQNQSGTTTGNSL